MTIKRTDIDDKKARSLGQTSLEDRIGNVCRAFYTQHPDIYAHGTGESDIIYWTVETFDDHLIVDENRSFYRVNFTVNGDEIEFSPRDEWQQVSTEWTVINDRGASDTKSAQGGPTSQTRKSATTIKMLGQNRLGGYAVIWGGADERDLDGEWFDSETEELDSIFKAIGKVPYLYNHAMDGALKTAVVGAVDLMEEDDVGLWYEVQLDQANQYISAIRQLVDSKGLGTSSGTLSGAVRVEKSGRIARWPIVEVSATPTPADPRQRTEHPVSEAKSLFKSIGLELDTYIGNSGDPAKAAKAKADGTSAPTAADESDAAKRLSIELELLELTI